MWQSIDKLMGRGHVQAKSSLTANDFYRFFIDKVAKIRYSTVDAPEPSYDAVPLGCMLGYFWSIDCDNVIKLIMSLPDEQCAPDPMPTWLLCTLSVPAIQCVTTFRYVLQFFQVSICCADIDLPWLKMMLRTTDTFRT